MPTSKPTAPANTTGPELQLPLATSWPPAAGRPLSDWEAEYHAARIRPSWASSLPPVALGTDTEHAEAGDRALLLARTRRLRARALGRVAGLLGMMAGLLLMITGNDPLPDRPDAADRPRLIGVAGARSGAGSDFVQPRRPVTSRAARAGAGLGPRGAAGARLQVTTDPAEAQIRLDGRPVPNPYDGRVPRGETRTMEVSAPGYRPQTRVLHGDRDQTLGVALQRTRSVELTGPR